MRGNRAENAEKVIFPYVGSEPVRGNHLFELFKVIFPHLGSSLDGLEPGANNFFELFRAENAEKVIPPHLGSCLDLLEPGARNHLFKMPKVIPPHLGSSGPLELFELFRLFRAEKGRKGDSPHLGPGARCGGITFLSFQG